MAQQLLNYLFDGQEGQFDVGWKNAFWYDFKNIQIPIDHANGTPTHWLYWEAEGQSYDGDDKDWNRFRSPEQRFVWKKFLPQNEHADLLNDIGQGYHWFHGTTPFHSRLARPTMLQQGQVELSFEFWADWYKWEGHKVPKTEVSDSNGCRVELHIIDTGLDQSFNWDTDDKGTIRQQQSTLQSHLDGLPGNHNEWLIVKPSLGHTVKTKTFDVPRTGLYLLVFGVYTVWAVPDGKGSNGLFVLSAGATQTTATGTPTTSPPTGGQTETPPTTTTGGQGTPRVQYERTYQLIHSSVSDQEAAQIFLDGYRKGKTTGTSADDAGVGDLNVRIVEVYGWPAANQAELLAWFNTHYPGTQVTIIN